MKAIQCVRPEGIVWLNEKFHSWTADREWLAEAGRQNWLVISRDKKIHTSPGQRAVMREFGVGCFCFTQPRNATKWEYLKLIATTLDEMERLYAETDRPFLYGINKDGLFRQIAL